MAYCANCGASITDGSRFCPGCGMAVVVAPAPREPDAGTRDSENSGSYNAGSYNAGSYSAGYTEPGRGASGKTERGSYDPVIYEPRGLQGGYRASGGYAGSQPDVEDNRLICILCYCSILFLIPLLTRQDSPYVRFHSNQGLVLLLVGGAVSIVSGILPLIGWLVGAVGGIFVFVCFIMGIVNTVAGRMKPLPLIGSIVIIK